MNLSVMTVGGPAWLNLLNTVYRSQQHEVDLLRKEAAVREWLFQNELIQPDEWSRLEPHRQRLAAELAGLRDICRSLLVESKRNNEVTPAAVEPLEKRLERIPLRIDLQWESGKLMERYRALDPLDHILYQIGLSAVRTLKTLPLERIRECEHVDCILHFADTSKAGKRRWCSMDTCGNRHKAAEFYARKKQKS
ncbi:CGNR zinc finger domain-containing protein [Brevibacillus sp. H7]|jgi:predicted RNA-binding Zn ribbon-like protein|uniref:CGNR zinc finger domain-containing protein n=1 Tax=Brevibacillus sp. H7 TaxID=3349138 RepID=UPI00380AFB69